MGTIGCFYALKDEDLDAIVERPERMGALSGEPMAEAPPSLLSRLFGSSRATKEPAAAWQPSEPPEEFDVDKAWHGIHFLLTGTAWEGEGPLAFMLVGGREINEDTGDGPARGFSSSEVREISAALNAVDVNKLYEQADPAQFTAHDIYPEIWAKESKEDCVGYVIEYLKELEDFLTNVVASKRALIVYLG